MQLCMHSSSIEHTCGAHASRQSFSWVCALCSLPHNRYCAEASQPCSSQHQPASGASATPGRPAMSAMCRQAAIWQEAALVTPPPSCLCPRACRMCAGQQRTSRASAACGYLVCYKLADVQEAVPKLCHSRPKQVLAYRLCVRSRSSSVSHCIL